MLYDLALAALGHFMSALTLGLLPLIAIALCTGVVIGLVNLFAARKDWWALFGYSLVFAAAGAALGLMLGASREPAVKAFLPALVTLLSGLFIYVFPRESDTGKMQLLADRDAETPIFVRRFVIVGVAALMLGATMGSFWGGSIRNLKEEDARRYAEWQAEYTTVKLPLRLEVLKRDLGLSKPPATATATGD